MIDEVATETGLLLCPLSLFLYFLNIHRGRLVLIINLVCVCGIIGRLSRMMLRTMFECVAF